MKIIVYSGYNNGFGDLSFGKKLGEFLRGQYPHAEVILITSAATLDGFKKIHGFNGNNPDHAFALILSSEEAEENFLKFNQQTQTPLSHYSAQDRSPPDLVIAAPTLTFNSRNMLQLCDPTTPILLMPEYDYATWVVEDAQEGLERLGYTKFTVIRTGLGSGCEGIFIDEAITQFDKTDPTQVAAVFAHELPQTRAVLLGNHSPEEYFNNTHIAVNYSHNNAHRFLGIHSLVAQADKNTDVVILGEAILKQQLQQDPIFQNYAATLLNKGFAQVIYHKQGEEPVVIASSNQAGPTYRIIHPAPVSAMEAVALRKIGGSFGGATGDQSYSEAIAGSSMIVYECMQWKQGVVAAMQEIAGTIDPSGTLTRILELLSKFKVRKPNEDNNISSVEYQELDALLKKPGVEENFQKFRTVILQKKNLIKNINPIIAKCLRKTTQHNTQAWRNPAMTETQATKESVCSTIARLLCCGGPPAQDNDNILAPQPVMGKVISTEKTTVSDGKLEMESASEMPSLKPF